MIILYAVLIAAAAYLFFIAAPGAAAFFAVFTRKSGKPFREMNIEKTYYAPYIDDMNRAFDRVTAHPTTRLTVTAKDGTPLAADYYDNGSADTFILLHGYNTPPLNNFSVIADYLLDKGFNLLIPYARGHLYSGGKRATLGLKEQYDLLCWIDKLHSEMQPRNLFIYGMSMGCATAALASDKILPDRVRGLILDCGYTSPYDQLKSDIRRRGMPYMLMLPVTRLIAKLVIHEDIRTSAADSLRRCRIPVLFFHGKTDGSVPFALGLQNYNACASEKTAVFPEHADHTMSFSAGGEQSRSAIDAFIAAHSVNNTYRKDGSNV